MQLGMGSPNDSVYGDQKGRTTMKIAYLRAGLSLAVVLLLVALGTANAADKWNLLGEKVIKSTDPSTEIKGEEGKTFKEDVKRAKLSVEGADVEITNVVFHWRGQEPNHLERRSREAGRRNGCEGRSSTRGDPLVREPHV